MTNEQVVDVARRLARTIGISPIELLDLLEKQSHEDLIRMRIGGSGLVNPLYDWVSSVSTRLDFVRERIEEKGDICQQQSLAMKSA